MPLRDFDTDREARQRQGRSTQFKLDGQTFDVQLDVRPEVVVNYLYGGRFSIEVMEELFAAFLTDESLERWKTLRARVENPVTIQDVGAIATWLIEEETGRPTRASGDSSPGRETSTATSTDGSPSPDETSTPSLSVAS